MSKRRPRDLGERVQLALNLLDTEPEERFDQITRLAQRVFGTSMSPSRWSNSRRWSKPKVASLSLAIGDELTGLSNRRGFEMLGERLLRASRRLGLPLSIVYADLDNMKPIHDT
jgi:GGDEF domain-containing protein